jgi:hypothetical protein
MNKTIQWFDNEDNKDDVREYLLKYIYIYPLRAACSVVVEDSNNKFIEEYIVSQLLLQWILENSHFDGICYESCILSDVVVNIGEYNVVLVTNDFDSDGFDRKLCNNISIGEPSIIDINDMAVTPKPTNCQSE